MDCSCHLHYQPESLQSHHAACVCAPFAWSSQGGLRGALSRGPMLLGPSRKGFLGRITGQSGRNAAAAAARDAATVAACTVGVAGGADIVRVHNVRACADGVRVADAVYRGWGPR